MDPHWPPNVKGVGEKKWPGRGSNPGPFAYHASTLPLRYQATWSTSYTSPCLIRFIHKPAQNHVGTVINSVSTLNGQILEVVTRARYLGVDISDGLYWNSHIDKITGNANLRIHQTKHKNPKHKGERNSL